MSVTPIFTGRVLDGGLLVLNRPKDYGRHLRRLAGQFVDVIVRRQRSQRSLAQNRWLFGVAIPLMADELGYDRHEREQLHYALVDKCFGTRWDKRLKAHVPTVRSSQLSTAEFNSYMDWLVRFAATEWGIVVPLPNEVDLTTVEAEVA